MTPDTDVMFLLSLLSLTLVAVLASPGAPWTEEETLIVKSKLYSVFKVQNICKRPLIDRRRFKRHLTFVIIPSFYEMSAKMSPIST